MQDAKRAAECWVRRLTPTFRISRFGISDWESFVKARSAGELDAWGHPVTDPSKRQPVRPRAVARDLKWLRAACRRACVERTPSGGFRLDVDPTRGLQIPIERNPRRPVCDADRLDALLAVADRVTMRPGVGKAQHYEPSHLRTILRLTGDLGRRIHSVRTLRWSDWHPEMGTNGKMFWRKESDKLKRDWLTPVTAEVRDELERFRRERPGVGDAVMFPSPNDPTRPVSYSRVLSWLRRAERLAGLSPIPRSGYHAMRRGWATARKHLPLKDICEVGGWTDTATLLKCYITSDDQTQEEVVSNPRRFRKMG